MATGVNGNSATDEWAALATERKERLENQENLRNYQHCIKAARIVDGVTLSCAIIEADPSEETTLRVLGLVMNGLRKQTVLGCNQSN